LGEALLHVCSIFCPKTIRFRNDRFRYWPCHRINICGPTCSQPLEQKSLSFGACAGVATVRGADYSAMWNKLPSMGESAIKREANSKAREPVRIRVAENYCSVPCPKDRGRKNAWARFRKRNWSCWWQITIVLILIVPIHRKNAPPRSTKGTRHSFISTEAVCRTRP
jgi:hypothetical protein